MEHNFCFAMAHGRNTANDAVIKRYVGVAPVKVLSVNPTKEVLEGLYGTTLEKDPIYVGETEVNGNKVAQIRIDFIVKTIEEKCGVNLTTKLSYFVNNAVRVNRDGSKCQVIDSYGRTAWVTKDELKDHAIPVSSKGTPINIAADYRPALVGEEDLTNFMKIYLGIANPARYMSESGTWVMKTGDDLKVCECRLDDIQKYFTGNVGELCEAIAWQPENSVKALFGVKHSDKGDFQTFYSQMVLSPKVKTYTDLENDVKDRQGNGAYPNVEFSINGIIGDIMEYSVEPTDLSSPADVAPNPWESFNS